MLYPISAMPNVFCRTSDGTPPPPSRDSRWRNWKSFVDQEFAQIKHVLHGISLLGQCPDSINAALICRGEKMSIAIMAGVLEARGHNVTVIDPVEKLTGSGALPRIYRRYC